MFFAKVARKQNGFVGVALISAMVVITALVGLSQFELIDKSIDREKIITWKNNAEEARKLLYNEYFKNFNSQTEKKADVEAAWGITLSGITADRVIKLPDKSSGNNVPDVVMDIISKDPWHFPVTYYAWDVADAGITNPNDQNLIMRFVSPGPDGALDTNSTDAKCQGDDLCLDITNDHLVNYVEATLNLSTGLTGTTAYGTSGNYTNIGGALDTNDAIVTALQSVCDSSGNGSDVVVWFDTVQVTDLCSLTCWFNSMEWRAKTSGATLTLSTPCIPTTQTIFTDGTVILLSNSDGSSDDPWTYLYRQGIVANSDTYLVASGTHIINQGPSHKFTVLTMKDGAYFKANYGEPVIRGLIANLDGTGTQLIDDTGGPSSWNIIQEMHISNGAYFHMTFKPLYSVVNNGGTAIISSAHEFGQYVGSNNALLKLYGFYYNNSATCIIYDTGGTVTIDTGKYPAASAELHLVNDILYLKINDLQWQLSALEFTNVTAYFYLRDSNIATRFHSVATTPTFKGVNVIKMDYLPPDGSDFLKDIFNHYGSSSPVCDTTTVTSITFYIRNNNVDLSTYNYATDASCAGKITINTGCDSAYQNCQYSKTL